MNHSRQLIRTLLAAALVACAALGFAQQSQPQGDPPARVANLTQIEGSVAFAPAGETEWADAPVNRPITRGDRLWTDKGSRAEVHMGSSVLHMDGQSFVDITELDQDVLQAALNDGTVNARVRELLPNENFEIDTPQLAFRATQPGDYRIDVDAQQGTTRVVVRSGEAQVFGVNGQPMVVRAGQQLAFTGQNLELVPLPAIADNGFDRWAEGRNRQEDQSVTARYVPRDVVGYQQLDTSGTWAQDATYGPVWYPRVTVADWAPYRYGHWDFIVPWGWTWVDDAPWGFAPFHYGRWAQIGPRWAWVPGRLGPRPVYAPALVAFVGGNGGVDWSISFGSSPGIGWFPLGPGEAWRPTYRASNVYITNVNRAWGNRFPTTYVHQHRPNAWTSVRVEDFTRGRPVNRHWQPVRGNELGRAQVTGQAVLPPPQPRRFVENNRPAQVRALPPPQLAAPAVVNRAQLPVNRPQPVFQGQAAPRPPITEPRVQQERQVRDQQREQQQQAREQQREQQQQAREQQQQARQQQQAQREQQQQVQQQRQQQVQAQRENVQRQHQAAQEQAMRQQQQAQERAARQQEQAARQQQRQQQQEMRAAQRAQPQAHEPPQRPQPQQQQQPAPQRERGRPQLEQQGGNQGGEEGRGHGRGRGG